MERSEFKAYQALPPEWQIVKQPMGKHTKLDYWMRIFLAPWVMRASQIPMKEWKTMQKVLDDAVKAIYKRAPDLAPTHPKRRLEGRPLSEYVKVCRIYLAVIQCLNYLPY